MILRWLLALRAWWLAPVTLTLRALAEQDAAVRLLADREHAELRQALGAISLRLDELGGRLADLERAHNRLSTEQGWRYDHTVGALEDVDRSVRHLTLKAFGTEPPARQWRQAEPRALSYTQRQ